MVFLFFFLNLLFNVLSSESVLLALILSSFLYCDSNAKYKYQNILFMCRTTRTMQLTPHGLTQEVPESDQNSWTEDRLGGIRKGSSGTGWPGDSQSKFRLSWGLKDQSGDSEGLRELGPGSWYTVPPTNRVTPLHEGQKKAPSMSQSNWWQMVGCPSKVLEHLHQNMPAL